MLGKDPEKAGSKQDACHTNLEWPGWWVGV